MRIDFGSIKPIYLQIAEAIEDEILLGRLQEGDQVYSQIALSKQLKVNPATAAKGINLLVQKGILEKQRGLAMTVVIGAKNNLLDQKKENELRAIAKNLVLEAEKISVSKETLLGLVGELFDETSVAK